MSASILVPFSIARSALAAEAAASIDPGHIRRLVRLWKHLGVLVVRDEEGARRNLVELVRHMPQEVRKTLSEALIAAEQQRLRVCSDAEVPVMFKRCPVEVPEGCANRAAVHAADSPLAAILRKSLPADFEAAPIDLLDTTRAFETALELSSDPVARYSDVGKAWSERVAPVLAFARRRITLVDHYAVSAARRYRNKRGKWEKSGLWRFLRDAAKHKGAIELEVIAGDDASSPGAVVNDLRECIDEVGGRTRKWKVSAIVPQSHRFKEAVHYRSILVDSTSCLLLDSGIEGFDGEKLRRTLPTQLLHPGGPIASDIDELRRSARPVVI